MLDIYSTEQKVSILTQIMKEESTGASLRDCCKAQGITLQTFIDWKARAQKHNQFDTLHLNGVHPERKPSRFRHEKPKTALQLALENAQRKHYPDDNPEDLHALEHGEPEPILAAEVAPEPPPAPAAPVVSISPQPIPEAPASGPVIEPVYPIYDSVRSMLDKEPEPNPVNQSNEVIDMPKATEPSTAGRPRGLSAVLHQRMPWLAALEKKIEKTMGPKPGSKEPGYTAWIAARKAAMTPEQIQSMDDFYGISKRGPRTKMPPPPVAKKQPKPAQLDEQKEMVAVRANGVNGSRRPVSPEIEALAEQHAHISTQIAEHNRQPNREQAEIARLKKALMVLTLENLELRGLL